MKEWPGFDLIRLFKDAPALDPIIIDKIDKPLGEAVYEALMAIRARLSMAGFKKYNQAIIAKKEVIRHLENYELPDVELIASNHIGNYCYILTKEADGRLFIHPPYKKDHSMMSWIEYFLVVQSGERLNIMIDVPWAQAKIAIAEKEE